MLKAFTKNDGFYRTGNLYRSIKFKTTYIDSQFDFKLDAVDYIKYIDNGNIMLRFFERDEVEELIGDFVIEQMFEED